MNNVIHMFSDMEDMEEVEVPFGSLEEEVADDVPVLLSEGEYVVPADVVRYWGLKHLEEMRTMAKCGLMSMEMDGRLHKVDDDDDVEEEVEVQEEEEEEGNEDEETMLMMQEMYSMEEPEMMEFDIDDMQEDMSEEEEVDFDGKKKIADDDDDEFDEDDLVFTVRAIGMSNGGTSEPGDEASGATDADAAAANAAAAGADAAGMGRDMANQGPSQTQSNPNEDRERDISVRAGLSKGYNETLNYTGTPMSRDLMDKMSKMSVKEKEDLVDEIAEARVANKPTSREMDLNAQTEMGFQQANPGITDFVDVAATILGRVSPAIGAVMSVGNTINAMTGRDTVGINVPSVVSGIMGMTGLDDKVGEKMSGFADSLSEFAESVPGTPDDTYGREEPTGQQIEEQMKKLSETDMADLQKIINQTIDIKGVGKIPIRNSLASSVLNSQRNDEKADTTGYPIPLS